MKVDAWHLPWGRETVSHGIIDVNRGCNITCRACYNSRPPAFKSLEEIKTEVRELRVRRTLGAVSIAGGEPLLHPGLNEIIRYLKDDGLCVHLFSNGVLLDDKRCEELRDSGLDIVFVHIDRGQTRPDLPNDPTREQVRRLWDEKSNLLARHGIDVGLTMTAYAGELADVRDIVEYSSASPHVNYLLVTLFRDTDNIAELTGNIDAGIRGRLIDPDRKRSDTLTNWDMIELMRQLGMRPFAYLGSNKDRDDPRWLSYLVASKHRDGRVIRHSIKASGFERAGCALSIRLAGKYPMYLRQSTPQLLIQLILNAITGGHFIGNMKFLFRALLPGHLSVKRLLFQCPAQLEPDGTLRHCLNCPDAVVKNGGLVPLCISDRVK